MRNIVLAISIILIIFDSGCNDKKIQKQLEEATEKPAAIDSATSQLKWMKLNNEWVPLITDIDKLLHSGKEAYEKKDFKEAANKILEAEVIVNNKAIKNKGHKDFLNSSKSLKALSKKIEMGSARKEEIDSVLYKVCDVQMKNCWILKDRDTDLWVPEKEFQIHLDSSYYYMVKNDTIKSKEELTKANWIIYSDSKKYCSPEGEKTSDKIRKELHSIKLALIKGEQHSFGKVKSGIARTYFLKADNHYAYASQISFNYDNDRLEGDIDLAREIKATVFYLQRAFSTRGITLSEKETFQLENALLLGNELLGGYTHPKEEITESLKDIGKIMIRYRSNFQPEII